MEQKEKIEKPEWVKLVDTLPEFIRQQVGSTCAGTISTLIQLGMIRYELFDQICIEAHNAINAYLDICEEAKNFVDDIVKDALKDENL